MEPHQRRTRRPRMSFNVTEEGRPPSASRGLAGWLNRVVPVKTRGVVNVALTSDAKVRALNRRYRRVDRATDVLSFRYAGSHGRVPRTDPPAALGDIVIARGVARRQARAAGHDERTEVRILALHGLLHLLGYDHHRGDGVMAKVERRLRK